LKESNPTVPTDSQRMLAKALKALVRRYYPDAEFTLAQPHADGGYIDGISFQPASRNSNGTVQPANAMLEFRIGAVDDVDSEWVEKQKMALKRDLRILFEDASDNVRFSPSATSYVMGNQCDFIATVYGIPEALYDSMKHAMEYSVELRSLLPRGQQGCRRL